MAFPGKRKTAGRQGLRARPTGYFKTITRDESFDHRGRAVAAQPDERGVAPCGLRRSGGRDLRGCDAEAASLRVRLHPAGHHASRRQRPSDPRRARGAGAACERHHHFGARCARRPYCGSGEGRRRLPSQAFRHGRASGAHPQRPEAAPRRLSPGYRAGQRAPRPRGPARGGRGP